MEFFNRFKNALFLIAVLLAQTIALAMQVRRPADPSEPDGPQVRLVRLWGAAAVTPMERLAHAVGSGVRNGWSDYIDLRHVRRNNQELRQKIESMRTAEAAIAEDALEGRRLEKLLGFRERYVGSTVAAQVIGSSGSEQSRVLTIDKGWRDGLKPDMAVITQDGIVGKLRDVFPTTSQVLEINDPTSGAGVLLASTRMRAILRGTTTGGLQIGNLTADSRIKPGETVLTSGGDQVYPRGLPVGTVQSIVPDPERQPYTDIAIAPAVDLSRVEEVLVITQTQSDLPQGAEEDLSAAEAKHGAEMSAEHLPGIQAPPGGGPAATAPPVAVVPRPLPTVHPDRFTSGATPQAAEMTPGAASATQAGHPAQRNDRKGGDTRSGDALSPDIPGKRPQSAAEGPSPGLEPQTPP
jgi:rod shape-determining protein MreC